MLSIMLIATTYKYTADGPFYPLEDIDSENCKVNWWVNLLMLNNLVKVSEQVCTGRFPFGNNLSRTGGEDITLTA